MRSTMFDEIIKIIRDLYGKEGPIPLHVPVFIGNEKKYLNDCVDTTFVSSVGPYVEKFEQAIANYTGAKAAVAVVNGTNALYLALLSIGVENNTEVLTQPLTFIATTNAISYIGAYPVFIDVDEDTLGLSPDSLEQWLAENAIVQSNEQGKLFSFNKITGRRISACVPMHTFGHPAKIDKIVEICKKYYIPVVEDAAESLGSFYKGKHTGTFGKIGVLSFNGNKIITTGGGGMIITDDIELAKQIKHLTTQAKVNHPWEFYHDKIGYNYRMPNINAALGLAQFENIDFFLKNKRETAQYYKEKFKLLGIPFIEEPSNATSNYWLNSILFENETERDNFLAYAHEQQILCRPAWKLMTKLPMYRNALCGNIKNAIYFEERIVNIPSSVRL